MRAWLIWNATRPGVFGLSLDLYVIAFSEVVGTIVGALIIYHAFNEFRSRARPHKRPSFLACFIAQAVSMIASFLLGLVLWGVLG